jgi:hypothetical protein
MENEQSNEIIFYNANCILVINKTGKLRKLYVPFQVKCVTHVRNLKPGTIVFVEEVAQHEQLLIIYRVFNEWMPYNDFSIIISY